MERIDYNLKGKKKKNNLKNLLRLMAFFCIITLIYWVSNLYLKIEQIKITGNHNVKTEFIEEKLSYLKDKNILTIRPKLIEKSLINSLPFKEVKVSLKLPNTVIVKVTERDVKAAIPFNTDFLLLDAYGNVIKIDSDIKNYSVPIITGIAIKQAEIGKMPIIQDEQTVYTNTLYVLNEILPILNQIAEIHVEKGNDGTDFYIYTIDGIKICFNQNRLKPENLTMIANILEDIRKNNRGKGEIDLNQDIPVFRPY